MIALIIAGLIVLLLAVALIGACVIVAGLTDPEL